MVSLTEEESRFGGEDSYTSPEMRGLEEQEEEIMALCQVRFFSTALGSASEMWVLVPDEGEGPFPVLYLLHGLLDDASIWLRRTRLEWYVRRWPWVVVMPDGGRGWYSDALAGPAYETHLLRDVMGQAERIFPGGGQRAIAGLSMGGYGALKFALKYPDRFVAAASLSGAVGIAHDPYPEELREELERIFGPQPAGGPHDLFALATQAKALRLPALWLDCGLEDFLLEQNRAFHAHLEHLDIPHTYREFPGAHNWDYWDEHIRDVLKFLGEVVGTPWTEQG